MEAFSDGVFAVILTLMVLALKTPYGNSIAALRPILAVFVSYVLSFVYVAIYWNNHHHLLQAAQHVTGGTLWANLHLLFWLSLTPWMTACIGGNHLAPWSVALYGIILLFAAIAYFILVRTLIAHHGKESVLANSIGKDRKGIVSVFIYAAAIPMAFVQPAIACAAYVLVAIMWLVPDKRIERRLAK